MKKIYTKLFDLLEIGDDFPTVIVGVINLSPESFYRGSVYEKPEKIRKAASEMIKNGAQILDIGGRSTAPWSEKISIEEEVNRMKIAMENVCEIIPDNIIISVDTQYREVAENAFNIATKTNRKIIINDVSCLKTDPSLTDFIVEKDLPIIIMASMEVPGDLCTIEEITEEFNSTIENLKKRGYNENNIILDPGIGHWIEKKTHIYDLKIIGNLHKLKELNKPILVAISRKSFIGTTLNIPEPEKRLNGTLAATAIAIYNGAHIVRTHDVTQQLFEFVKMSKAIDDSTEIHH
ncbi:MAG: dihydropteroate synthase [Candidatus Lokiarchaeota archaeon]|nr:dihydropteroate synthase [Candidatus Lokiarchaeota archaeon]